MTRIPFPAILLAALFAILTGMAVAQPAVATITPAAETAAQDADATPTRSMMDTIADVFGESGAELSTNKKDGEIIQTTNSAGDVVSLIARNEVVLKSDKLDLESEYLQIDAQGQKVIATGNVHLRIQDRTAICGRFEYDIQKKISILRDNPRIVGKGTDTSSANVDVNACEIIIEEDALGNTKTILRACEDKGNVLKIGGKDPEAAAPTPAPGAIPIDANNPSDVGIIIGGSNANAPAPTPASALPR